MCTLQRKKGRGSEGREADGGAVAVGVDDRQDVGPGFGDDAEFVLAVGGLAQIAAVEVPVEGGVGIAVGGGQDDALASGVEGDGGADAHAVLRVDDLDGPGAPVAGVVRMERRQRMVSAVRTHIIPLLGWRKYEARDIADFGHGPTVAVHLPSLVGTQVDQLVVGTGIRAVRRPRCPDAHDAVGLTQVGGGMAAEGAADHFFQFVGRFGKPSGGGEQVEEVEHHGCGIADAAE